MQGRGPALDKLARHLGMLVDWQEIEHKGGFAINVKVAPLEPKEARGDGQSGPARAALVNGTSQLEAQSCPAEALALGPSAASGRERQGD